MLQPDLCLYWGSGFYLGLENAGYDFEIKIYQPCMYRHHLIMFYRNFKRFKSSFIINLIGLSTGLLSVLLIYLWVFDELHMDKFTERDSARHYQILSNFSFSNTIETDEGTPGLLAEALADD